MNRAEAVIGIVGCGFVADFYMATIVDYPWIRVAGVFDIDTERLRTFTRFHKLHGYRSLDDLLSDDSVNIIVNLTNPRAHYEVSHLGLQAGKHVYSEKPLAMDYTQAEALVALAETKRLHLSSAPCSLLGSAAQTLWRAIRDGAIGEIRLVQAELDDGMIHQMPYRRWRSASGAPWPYKDEFEVGCTLEHAGYYLTWLVGMFGPVETVTAFSDCLVTSKVPKEALDPPATPDFSVAVLKFERGVVARLSTTIIAPRDHSIRVIGDTGVLSLKDCWVNDSTVYVRRFFTIRRKTFLSPIGRPYRVPGSPRSKAKYGGGQRMDYAAGIAELAHSILEGRECRLSKRFSLHVTEVALAIQNAGTFSAPYKTKSRFDPITPMDWAHG